MTSSTTASTGWHFDNGYVMLPQQLFSAILPTPVASPQLILLNERVAQSLGLDFSGLSPADIASLFSGNVLPPGAQPIAQVYAGHQFGHFNLLGDGRAILLGEQLTPDGKRYDIQLKGAGATPYSRRGDGRATLSAMLREYLMSEAMYHLGIPTTGSLAVVATGEKVYREEIHNGAVLTRIAASHIRVGTFEYIGRFQSKDILQTFLDYTISRHYPELESAENKALALLEAVLQRQVHLMVDWLRVGFIHGVMNTDNMSIAGETIDYGPCAFMNRYDPQTAFSSIDVQGRYAYGNQPGIAQWNLARLAGSLLPLIDEVPEKAAEPAQAIIDTFPALFDAAWLTMMRRKLGWAGETPNDTTLINSLLQWMQDNNADYTNIFLLLQERLSSTTSVEQLMETYAILGTTGREQPYDEEGLKQWLLQWQQRVSAHGQTNEAALQTMQAVNPIFIPRNHQVEAALEAAQRNDFSLLHSLLAVLQHPYTAQPEHQSYQLPPTVDESRYQTFCNT